MTQEKLKVVKRTYFPTHIFQVDVPDCEELNADLLEKVYSERERDQKGITRSNFPKLGGWHSHNNLHKQEDFSALVDIIDESTRGLSEHLGYAEDREIKIGTMWSIINPPGSSNRAHVHPGCLWSGVYYIQSSENAGSIEFVEPRTTHLMNQAKFKPNTKRAKENWTKVRFTPTAGRLLIFPSWLYHAVDPNMSTAEGNLANRVIVSFNLNQVPKKKK